MDIESLQIEVDQLRQALVARASIDQAKGIVMLRFGVDADTAFRILARWSSVTKVKVRVVACALVQLVDSTPGLPGPDPVLASFLRESLRATEAPVHARLGTSQGG